MVRVLIYLLGISIYRNVSSGTWYRCILNANIKIKTRQTIIAILACNPKLCNELKQDFVTLRTQWQKISFDFILYFILILAIMSLCIGIFIHFSPYISYS